MGAALGEVNSGVALGGRWDGSMGQQHYGNIEQPRGFLAVVPGKLQNLRGFGIDGHGFSLCVIQTPDIASFLGVAPELFVSVAETHRIIENLFQQLPR